MADTQRTRAQVLALMADNVTGQISAQDFRDFIVTVMNSEFANEGDFWAQPQAKFTLTDKTARGNKMYSQYMGSDCSWMNVMFRDASTGYWFRANVSNSDHNRGVLALAMDSYTSDYSTATVLLEGIVYDSSFSTIFSRLNGRPVYLMSVLDGSISITATTNSMKIVGYVDPSDAGSACGKWYFKPDIWSLRGV